MRDILGRALERTASLWPQVERGAQWIQKAAAILANRDQASARTVLRRYRCWLAQLEQDSQHAGLCEHLRKAAQCFLQVTRSYGTDLFHCYRIAGLPRTNNALEQTCGSLRSHERRASGRKVASPSLVTTGSARLPAALYTRTQSVTVAMLSALPHERWRTARADLDQRRRARCLRYRFRSNPDAYLAQLEQACDKLTLPS